MFAAAVGTGLTTGLLAGMYIVAATLWWLQRAWRLTRGRWLHPDTAPAWSRAPAGPPPQAQSPWPGHR